MRKISDGVKFFIELLKVNKLTRLVTGLVLASVCLKLSELAHFWIYSNCFCNLPNMVNFLDVYLCVDY